jgi:hypothetical protein
LDILLNNVLNYKPTLTCTWTANHHQRSERVNNIDPAFFGFAF